MDLLRSSPLFESAPEDVLQELFRSLERVRLSKGEAVCRLGDPGRKLFFIRSGQACVSMPDPNGVSEVLGYLGPGDHVGEMSLLTGAVVSADVTATTDTELEALDGKVFQRVCEENPILYREISRTLSKRLRETNQRRIYFDSATVSRFSALSPDLSRADCYASLTAIAESFCSEVRERPLLLIPLEGEIDPGDAAALRDANLLPEDAEVLEGPSLELRAKHGTLFEQVLADLARFDYRWYRIEDRWDLVVFRSKRGDVSRAPDEEGDPKDFGVWIERILDQLKPVYSNVFLSQLNRPLEGLFAERLASDKILLLLDLISPGTRRKATREDFVQFVPEGDRYAAEEGVEYWVASDAALAEFERVAGDLRERAEFDQTLKILFLHEPAKPILDYSRIRKIFTGVDVHSLPIGKKDERMTEVDAAKARSLSLQIGRTPKIAHGRVVRDIAHKKVGLALGGGGARGMAHVGVLKVLEEEGIPVDLVAGSSMGAVIAGAYAEGRPAERLQNDIKHHWSKIGNFLLDVLDYNFPRTHLLRGRKIRRMIETTMKDKTLEECHIPISVVCTDLIAGKEIVLDRGPLADAVRASGALPGIFQPVWWGDHLLVDGSVLNKVPALVLKQKGAKTVIAVNVTPDRERAMTPDVEAPASMREKFFRLLSLSRTGRRTPNILRILSRSLSVSGLHQSRVHSNAVDIEIKPRIEHFDFLRFDQIDQIVEAGAQAAREALPEIRKVLGLED